MSLRVFISYASVDKKDAGRMAKALRDIGIDYFLDRKDIDWGDDIADRIKKNLPACSDLIVVLSPASLKSQWVLFEIGQASALGKRILPFLIHPSLERPDFLKNYHYKTKLKEVKHHFQTMIKPSPLQSPRQATSRASLAAARNRVVASPKSIPQYKIDWDKIIGYDLNPQEASFLMPLQTSGTFAFSLSGLSEILRLYS